jgi:hypothetical protein
MTRHPRTKSVSGGLGASEVKEVRPPKARYRYETKIRKALQRSDAGMRKIAVEFGVGTGTVQRIRAEMRG